MSLSFCLLTRNQEALVGRCLRALADIPAEIILVDTGSTDNTVNEARALGAKTHVIPWQEDFSAAQNYTLAKATTDWIFWLNPDDELLLPDKAHLEAMLANPLALAYGVHVQEIAQASQPDRCMETLQVRLYRRHPDIRFVGRLHPDFALPLEELARREQKRVYLSDLVVRHHGYLSVVTPAKLRWAARLLELELKDRPGQLQYLIEYGRHLLWLNDPRGHAVLAEASEQVEKAAQDAAAPSGTVASLLEYLLTVSAEQSVSCIKALQARALALRWFPNSPPLLWALALIALKEEDYREAARLLEGLLQLGKTKNYDRSAAFDPAIMSDKALLQLAHCWLKLKDPDRAECYYGQLLNNPQHEAQAKHGYRLVQELRKAAAKF